MTTDPSDIVERLGVNAKSWRRDDAMEGRIGEEEARLNDEAAAEITRLRAALAAIKECDTRWRTGTLSSNEAMIEIAASIRARG